MKMGVSPCSIDFHYDIFATFFKNGIDFSFPHNSTPFY
jgi:hypothetical protein